MRVPAAGETDTAMDRHRWRHLVHYRRLHWRPERSRPTKKDAVWLRESQDGRRGKRPNSTQHPG